MLAERIFYLIESIDDILNRETNFGYTNDTKEGLQNLQGEITLILPFVRDIEVIEDKHEERSPLEISGILKDGEKIIGGLAIGKDSTNQEDVSSPTNQTIKDLIERIQKFCSPTSSAPVYNISTGNCQNYGQQQKTGSINVYTGVNSPPLTKQIGERRSYGHVQNCDLVGFCQEKTKLLHQLIENNEMRVVGIVGMGGSGKTTLAKHLYHHDDIKNHFDHRVWICVSQTWNKTDILYEILRKTKGAPMERDMVKNWSDDQFAENLFNYLSTKVYLVVLDDVWGVDAWNEISPALPPSEKSKFLITTRNEAVPKLVDLPFFVLEPELLSLKESFELFRKRAFIDGDPQSVFVDQGKEMVKKCKGLPLAITALAGALRGKTLLSDWMRVSKTLAQRIMKVKDSTTKAMVNEVLALSYHDLPHYIKPCFLYLSIFPEDEWIKAGILKRMWIAECLITQEPLSEDEKMLRAEEYMDELIQRYMVQDVERNYIGRVKQFQMHDLIREMCIENAQKESHRVSLCLKRKSLFHMVQEDKDSINRYFHPTNSLSLRSLAIFSKVLGIVVIDDKPHSMMLSLIDKFKLLRVLKLFDYGINYLMPDYGSYNLRLPEAVGNLIHLRYLGLRGLGLEVPENVGNLQNLLTLDVEWLEEGLSKNLWKLKRLRHLHFRFPLEMNKPQELRLNTLENLQTLKNLTGGNWMLSEMAGLSTTLRKLSIREITSEEQLNAVFGCPSILNLQTLKLEWYYSTYDDELQNMETLEKCEKLQRLALRGVIQESRPLKFPPNLVKLDIEYAWLEATDPMSVLGHSLPHLRVLRLKYDAYIGTTLTCNAGSFLKLVELSFWFLRNLEIWTVEEDAMPCLKYLHFTGCGSLRKFPDCGRFVSKLEQVTALNMSDEFQISLHQARKHNRHLKIHNEYQNWPTS